MPLIRCTKKLIAETGIDAPPAVDDPGKATLGNWYANLLRIERKECVIFTSERTAGVHGWSFVDGMRDQPRTRRNSIAGVRQPPVRG